MPAVRVTSRIAVAVLVAALGTGCSSGGSPEAGDSPPPSGQEVAYYSCLEKQGVVLEERDDEQLRVDKGNEGNNEELLSRAERKCEDLLPPPKDIRVPEEVLAEARKFSDCVRRNGFEEYPDPDPRTGDVEWPTELSADDRARMHAAEQECAPGDGHGDNPGG